MLRVYIIVQATKHPIANTIKMKHISKNHLSRIDFQHATLTLIDIRWYVPNLDLIRAFCARLITLLRTCLPNSPKLL